MSNKNEYFQVDLIGYSKDRIEIEFDVTYGFKYNAQLDRTFGYQLAMYLTEQTDLFKLMFQAIYYSSLLWVNPYEYFGTYRNKFFDLFDDCEQIEQIECVMQEWSTIAISINPIDYNQYRSLISQQSEVVGRRAVDRFIRSARIKTA